MNVKKMTDIFNLAFCLVAVLFLFMYPSYCIDSAKDGVTTALYIVLPSLFPFMVLSKYIINNNIHIKVSKIIGKPFEKMFGISKNYAVLFVLGCIGGYPIGAISISQLLKKREITIKDAEILIGFCNNCGPMFVIGTVGTLMLQNTLYGYILYAIHLISVMLCGIIMCRFFKPAKISVPVKSSIHQNSISSVVSSANSMLNIASYIIIFSVISKFVTVSLKKENVVTTIVLCVLEITTGIKNISTTFLNDVLKLSIISASLGFSGFCVLSQCKSVFDEQQISFFKYIISKTIIAALSFVISFITFSIILP